jgi:hypothetical protein
MAPEKISHEAASLNWHWESVPETELEEYREDIRRKPVDILSSDKLATISHGADHELDTTEYALITQSKQEFIDGLRVGSLLKEQRERTFLLFTESLANPLFTKIKDAGDLTTPEGRHDVCASLSNGIFSMPNNEYLDFVKIYAEKLAGLQDFLDKIILKWKPVFLRNFAQNINPTLQNPIAQDELDSMLNSVTYKIGDPLDHSLTTSGSFDAGADVVYIPALALLTEDPGTMSAILTHEILHRVSTSPKMVARSVRSDLLTQRSSIEGFQTGLEIVDLNNGDTKFTWLNEAVTQLLTLKMTGASLDKNVYYKKEIGILNSLIQGADGFSFNELYNLYFSFRRSDFTNIDAETMLSHIANVLKCDKEKITNLSEQIEKEGVDAVSDKIEVQVL